jgi:polyhydroxybutyrate depolymerase
MKYLLIAICFSLAGCATPNTNSPGRVPASADSHVPFSAPLDSAFYKGPLDVSAPGQTRAPGKLYLPVQYGGSRAWPLVILLHGFTGTAETEAGYLTLNYRVSTKGFILLAPEGTHTPQGTKGGKGEDLSGFPFWNATDACCDFGKTGVDDAGYIQALIDTAKREYNVDPARIYLVGHSNGGFMANRMACESGAQFAGIAVLGGGTYLDPALCKNAVPTPYLQIHAVDDETILYQKSPEYAAGVETAGQWLKRNGCGINGEAGPNKDFVFLIPGKDTSEQLWRHCTSGKEVEFWTIRKGLDKNGKPIKGLNAHVPLFNLTTSKVFGTDSFADALLDFLFSHRNQ